MKRLKKSAADRKICGECGGIAEYLNADPTLIRLGVVLLTCLSFGTVIVGYIAAALIMPNADNVGQ